MNTIVAKLARRVILDCGGSLAPISEELLSHCTIVSPNQTEAVCLGHQNDLMYEKLFEKHGNLRLLMKEGSAGATLIRTGVSEHCDAYEPSSTYQIVDTTGAGDTFTAAYAVSEDL